MATAEEAAAAKTQLAGDLAAGLDTLSLNQSLTFTKYVRLVLPLDGFIFWVKADLLSKSALMNATVLNAFALNALPEVVTPAPTFEIKGSLHYATEKRQEEAEVMTVSRVIFTAQDEVPEFRQIGPEVLYIATFQGLKFAFSSRKPFYKQAGLSHYEGNAVYSVMETQLVDAIEGFDSSSVVVSNSLPLWLALNAYVAPYRGAFRSPSFRLFPSFLIDSNLSPPFGAVHISDEPGRALQFAPLLGPTLTHDQLVVDEVRVTTYGIRNAPALDFLDLVYQYSVDTDAFGLMNAPVVRDDKETQVELGVLAQKKTISFEINYYQSTVRDIARQLILKAIPTFIVVPPNVESRPIA